MKVVLEHVRTHTVPHDLMEDLHAADVRFYEGKILSSSSRSDC
jgi:transcription factor SPT20